jgi:hypothetical protein
MFTPSPFEHPPRYDDREPPGGWPDPTRLWLLVLAFLFGCAFVVQLARM